MLRNLRKLWFLTALMTMLTAAAYSQTGTGVVRGTVYDPTRATVPGSKVVLTQVSTNCVGQERNSVCYGYPRVVATFAETVAADFFTRPADRASLAALQTLQTFPLDLETDEWGIALMKAQANVPDTLPGQAVTFVLLGDTVVENAVEPAPAGGVAAAVIAQSSAARVV